MPLRHRSTKSLEYGEGSSNHSSPVKAGCSSDLFNASSAARFRSSSAGDALSFGFVHGFTWWSLVFPSILAGAALDELVRGQAGIAHFGGALTACHRQKVRVQQTQLNQHGGLVPIDVLV